jgi:hypothetical protein
LLFVDVYCGACVPKQGEKRDWWQFPPATAIEDALGHVFDFLAVVEELEDGGLVK